MLQAIEHLASLAHKAVAYVSGPTGSWSSHRRWRAIKEACAKRTCPRPASVLILRRRPPVRWRLPLRTEATAFSAFNELLAIGMLRRFRARRVRVPEDISLTGCDDIFGADFCNPPLTTVASPIEQAGRVAVSMLLSQLDPLRGPTARNLTVLSTHHSFAIRASTELRTNVGRGLETLLSTRTPPPKPEPRAATGEALAERLKSCTEIFWQIMANACRPCSISSNLEENSVFGHAHPGEGPKPSNKGA